LGLKRKHIVIAIAFLSLWSIYALEVDSHFYLFEGGSAHYLVMTQSLAEHHRYWEYHLPCPEPHIKIPPLLSLMLVPIYAFFGMDILAIKMFFLLCLAIASLSGYLLFHKLTADWKKSMVIIFLSLLMPLNFSMMQKVASEIPYLALSYLSLFLLVKAGEEKLSLLKSILIGILLGLSCLLRTSALAMILAFLIVVIVDLLIKKSKQQLAQSLVILAISSAIFFGWAVRNELVKTQSQMGYFNFIFMDSEPGSLEQGMNDLQPPLWEGTQRISLSGLAKRVQGNLGFYMNALSSQVALERSNLPGAILVLLSLLGLVSGFRKYVLINACGILYLAQIILWPFTDSRFLSPLSGLLVFWIITGIFFLAERMKRKKGFYFAIVFLAFLLLGLAGLGFVRNDLKIIQSIQRASKVRHYQVSRHFTLIPLTRERDAFAQMLLWIKSNTEKDAIIAAIDPYLVALVSERKATLFPATENNQEFWRYLKEQNVKYIMVDENYQDIQGGVSLMTPVYLLPALPHSPFVLQSVHQVPNSQTRLLSVSDAKE
jgi:hypothetical protein